MRETGKDKYLNSRRIEGKSGSDRASSFSRSLPVAMSGSSTGRPPVELRSSMSLNGGGELGRVARCGNRMMNLKVLLYIIMLQCLAKEFIVSIKCDFPPRITVQPNDLVVIEGESTELNCDAEGDPEPMIEWYHNGQLIKASSQSRTTMGGSIQFLDIRPAAASEQDTKNNNYFSELSSGKRSSDTGIYYCLAKNPLGQARSRNASLQVAYIKQEFKLAPKSKLVAIGESVTFDCLPQAWPEPQIQWRHNGRLIEATNENRLSNGSSKYSINRIAQTDLNSPSASNGIQPSSSSFPGGNNNNNNNQLIDLFGSQLMIRQVEKSDEGKYSCLVETKGTHRLIEHESPVAHLAALVKPYFIEAPEHKTVQVGGQVKLRCRMGGDPEPVISWRKQSGQPLSEKTQIDPIDKTLTLDQVTLTDQGTYVCEGENSVGSARSMASVSVNSRPKFIVQPVDQEVDQGAKVQIKCIGEANPPPLLFWYKEGHRQLMFAQSSTPSLQTPKQQSPLDPWPIAAPLIASEPRFGSMSSQVSEISPAINKLFSMPTNLDQLYSSSYGNNYFGNRIYVDSLGTLNIINVTSSDNGYYACALISSVGSILAKAKLTVRHSPNGLIANSDYFDSGNLPDLLHTRAGTSNVMKFDLLPPPVIKLGATNQTLPTNTSATLVCDVVSQVAYKIQWFFESQPLQEEPSRVIVLDTGALSINNLKTSDSGIYTCVVTAADDQMMPIAAPFEPLDSSMLTSAPPVQQSTSHSTMLKIASPLNPNIQFYRMDTFAYPSSPGPAYLVSTNGNDAITIAWAAPTDSGTLPIKEYVVEHYDTSQEHLGWRVIYRIKGKESLLIDGLSSEGSHFFVIRAANSHGTGPSSAIAGPMRTIAGEARYQAELQRRRSNSDPRKFNFDPTSIMRSDVSLARERLMAISTNLLSLTPVKSDSIRLHWTTQVTGNLTNIPAFDQTSAMNYPISSTPDVNDFLEGYSIRYRAIGVGDSLLNKDPLLNDQPWNNWPGKDSFRPSSLPLVTSYLDNEEQPIRGKRDLMNYFDYSQEFNEVRVADHKNEQYTINSLKPFTIYQFFVVPYYKDIDGVPSNILSAQTNEDRPALSPPNLTIRPLNNTAVSLLWIHIPPNYANGLLRGYMARINRSDVIGTDGQIPNLNSQRTIQEGSVTLNLPLSVLSVAPLNNYNSGLRGQPNQVQQYVVMYDLANLTFKSFYSIQLAAFTSAGSGPWSEVQNFIMDPKVISELRFNGGDFDDVISKSLISSVPHSFGALNSSNGSLSMYMIISITLLIVAILFVSGYIVYRRNDQKVTVWKKTISEHISNKFYMPSNVDHRGLNSIPQNIYDHQQHLIYSGSSPIAHQSLPTQTMWNNNNNNNTCINSSATGSLSSNGIIANISNDPNKIGRRLTGEQVLLMNKEANQRINKTNPSQLINQSSIDSFQTMNQRQIIHHGGDYYSVINNMSVYEELDPQQRNNMQILANAAVADRHLTASSNSDTSCPSSVTRLIPNQNFNRDLLSKTMNDNQRHDMILQQQLGFSEEKQPFATMINNDSNNRLQSMIPLSPYATTNLMNQASMPQQLSQNQMGLNEQSRQHNFISQHGGLTMDDSSKPFMNHQHVNGPQNPVSVFRTLQRNPTIMQTRGHQILPVQPQVVMQADGTRFYNYSPEKFQTTSMVANPISDMNPNLYEHIEYNDSLQNQTQAQLQMKFQQHQQQQHQHQHNSQTSNEIISSSTSSGSMKSSSQQQSPDQQTQTITSVFRRGSANANLENEAHDLRVFSSQQVAGPIESVNEKQRLDLVDKNYEVCDDDHEKVDETTAFRQKTSQGDNQRTKQLSKRKRQQHRNRLHNNNQKIG